MNEPMVWRDERAKLKRRGRVLGAARLKAEKHFQKREGTLADKNEAAQVEIENEHAGRMNFNT